MDKRASVYRKRKKLYCGILFVLTTIIIVIAWSGVVNRKKYGQSQYESVLPNKKEEKEKQKLALQKKRASEKKAKAEKKKNKVNTKSSSCIIFHLRAPFMLVFLSVVFILLSHQCMEDFYIFVHNPIHIPQQIRPEY